MKITPPWSRRRCAQPISVTVWPRSASLTRPQYVVLILVTPCPSKAERGRAWRVRGTGRAGSSGVGPSAPGAQPDRLGKGIGLLSRRTDGATTPIEITYLSASSTLIASAMTSLRGSIRKKPEVGFGVVGT